MNVIFSLSGIMIVDFVIGIFIGEVLDFIYDKILNNKEDQYLQKCSWLQSLIHWLEHYHWGMILLLVYCPIFNGIGLSLILDENRSECSFGYEKPEERDEYYHFIQSSIIGVIIFIVMIIRWITNF